MVEVDGRADPVSDLVNKIATEGATTSRPLIAAGCGGSGTHLVTALKAEHLRRDGATPANVKFIGLDVLAVPPAVSLSSGAIVQLEPGVEYLQLGQGCNPALLRQRRDEGRLDPELAELVDLQPGGHFARSLELGSEGERIFGMLGYRWSRREVRRLITRALTGIADVRAGASNGGAPAEAPIVIVAASVAGGVGSAIALPVAGEFRRTMRRLGMNVEASTFISVLVLPEAFPTTSLRLSNCIDTLNDFEIAQEKGVIPS